VDNGQWAARVGAETGKGRRGYDDDCDDDRGYDVPGDCCVLFDDEC
jgi:hypothetical protein